jgi:hypothetical protein
MPSVFASIVTFISKYGAYVIIVAVFFTFLRLYLNAIANHHELYSYMTNTPEKKNDDAWLFHRLVPNQCSPINLCLAAEFPILSKFLGYVNPYTPIFADVAARNQQHGLNFEILTKFIYFSETNPQIPMDNIDKDTPGVFQKVFGWNPTTSYVPQSSPKSGLGSNFLGIFNTILGIVAVGAML